MKELLDIYLKFFKIGAVTLGGGYAMLPILRRDIVEKAKWLTEEEIMDFYAISQGLPGIIAVNVGGFIGYGRKKEAGAVAAALGVVSPCPCYHNNYCSMSCQFSGKYICAPRA